MIYGRKFLLTRKGTAAQLSPFPPVIIQLVGPA
jgi:hypothetical protein